MSSSQFLPADAVLDAASSEQLLAAAAVLMTRAFDAVCADSADSSREVLVEQVAMVQAVSNAADGVRVVRIAQVAAIEEVRDRDTGGMREVRHELGWADEWVTSELGPLLSWGPRQAETRVGEALDAVTITPRLLREVGAGRLAAEKMHKAAAGLAFASEQVAAVVEAALLDQGIAGLTSTQIARRVPRLLARVDPSAVGPAARAAKDREVGVRCCPSRVPGLSEVLVVLDAARAARVMSAVEELARQLHRDCTTGSSLAQCRVDAFVDLVLQNACVDTRVVFQVPVLSGVVPEGFASVAGDLDGGEAVRRDAVREQVRMLADRLFPDPGRAGWTPVHRTAVDPPADQVADPPPDDDVPEVDWDHALAQLVRLLPDAPGPGVVMDGPHRGQYDLGPDRAATHVGATDPSPRKPPVLPPPVRRRRATVRSRTPNWPRRWPLGSTRRGHCSGRCWCRGSARSPDRRWRR